VAFVKTENLYTVAKEIVSLISEGEKFMSHQRPKNMLDHTKFGPETITKEEAIRRHALMSSIFDEDAAERLLPFEHTEEDLVKQQKWEQTYLKEISLVSTFGDIDQIGVEFDSKDFIAQDRAIQDRIEAETPSSKNYFASKAHGSDMFRCHPLSYI